METWRQDPNGVSLSLFCCLRLNCNLRSQSFDTDFFFLSDNSDSCDETNTHTSTKGMMKVVYIIIIHVEERNVGMAIGPTKR